MTTSIFTVFADLPESKLAIEQFSKAKEVFELTCQAIKSNLKIAESKFIKDRDLNRQSAIFEYYLKDPVINESGKHYHISRKAINPIAGDTDFYKDIDYASFKIVNNVYITTGGGYLNKVRSGDILSGQDIIDLESNIVPDIFKQGFGGL